MTKLILKCATIAAAATFAACVVSGTAATAKPLTKQATAAAAQPTASKPVRVRYYGGPKSPMWAAVD